MLYQHNQSAVNSILNEFQLSNKAAIVHATGTGKSYVIASVSSHYSRVLIIAPNSFILSETRKLCNKNVEFRTYASIMYETTPANDYELIVLDEFHRAGADKWGIGIQNLIKYNPQAKLLGTSATPIRYLDGQRNMADELFDGHVISHLDLVEAMNQNILPVPTYVSSLYDIDETSKNIKMKINGSRLDDNRKHELCRQLRNFKKNWQESHGVPTIIRKYFHKDIQRIIVFCSKVNRTQSARMLIGGWLAQAGYKHIHFYNINYKSKHLKKEMADFQEPVEDGTLKVAISVNMLNEGVHVPHVDGIIMLRSTISRIIIEQQIGRCLTANKNGKTPVILDLVNNMESVTTDYDNISNFNDTKWNKEHHTKDDNFLTTGFAFKVIDECRDIRLFYTQLENALQWDYESCKKEAQKYTSVSCFLKGSRSSYLWAEKNGILDEICSHMPKRTQYTLELVKELALPFSTRASFKAAYPSAYSYIVKHKLFNDVFEHMKYPLKYWDEQSSKQEALKYSTRTEFLKSCKGAYNWLCINGKLDEACNHMIIKVCRDWNKEEVMKIVKKLSKYSQLRKEYPSAYNFAKRNNILEEIKTLFKTHSNREHL